MPDISTKTGPKKVRSNKLQIKVDWLSFTLPYSSDSDKGNQQFKMLKFLGYKLDDFEEGAGRFFYNSSISLDRYLTVYYDDFSKEVSKYSAKNILVRLDWPRLQRTLAQKLLKKYKGKDWQSSMVTSFF